MHNHKLSRSVNLHSCRIICKEVLFHVSFHTSLSYSISFVSVIIVLKELLYDSESISVILTRNLLKASNYFFFYILLYVTFCPSMLAYTQIKVNIRARS